MHRYLFASFTISVQLFNSKYFVQLQQQEKQKTAEDWTELKCKKNPEK